MAVNPFKKKAPFYGVGGTRTHARPRLVSPKALPTELRLLLIGHTDNRLGFFKLVYLTTTLMIRVTTDLVPSRFLAYNRLFQALTGLMVIAYTIMIGKVI